MRCSEVMAVLSDYIDGTVDVENRARIDAHLRGCDVCERFGGQFAAIVETLRRQLAGSEPLPDDVARRLRERLRDVGA
ncbi:MAG TPA: zf-HC2 domain-containing protein [Thermoanaerobaculia bacterium]